MKRGVITLLCVTGSLAFAAGALANATDNPYQPIIDRNIFALKDPPPAPDPAEANKPPAPNVFLTGITTIFGNKRALIKTTPTPGPLKPGMEKPTEQSYVLAEGQREGDVEVLKIDEKAGTVQLRLAGKEMTINFDDNGVKTASVPAPGIPGKPGVPMPGGLVRPIGLPGATPAGISPGMTPVLPRTMRLPGSPTTPAAGSAMGYSPGVAAPVGGVGFSGFRSGSQASSSTSTERTARETAAAMSPEERLLMIEAHRLRAQQSGSPSASLFPPTVLSPSAPQAPGAPGVPGATP